MKLQNLTVIFLIIIIPVILLLSLYISTGIKTIKYQSLYDSGLLTATHDAIYAFEQNTARDIYSDNPERKRDILKASVKMFEKSLANTCGISAYNTDEIEEYIPAILFGMYDGFYMYAPSGVYNSEIEKTEYKHNLKNYVYYSEKLEKRSGWNTDATIIYSLDNYVTVSGDFGNGYEMKSGYLMDKTNSLQEGNKYKGIEIKEEIINGEQNTEGIKYYKEAYQFTTWFNEKIGSEISYLNINNGNDPEDENSAFVEHKKQIIKNKIEGVLNSIITAYSNRTWGHIYKMPKLSTEDFEKIYSNISMVTFFQGKNIGLTKYNGYCVLNSTNSNEYVNPNLMYFIDSNKEYHDIRCTGKTDGELTGYKIGDFQRMTLEEIDDDGEKIKNYKYKHKELACYECINGSLSSNKSIQSYINDISTDPKIKTAYWTSLGRERYRNKFKIDSDNLIVSFNENYEGGYISSKAVKYQKEYGELPVPIRPGYKFEGWFIEETEITPETIVQTTENHTLYAKWTQEYYTLDINQIINGEQVNSNGPAVKVDVYINGTKTHNDVPDYWQTSYAAYGTIFEIKDIKHQQGYEYIGYKIITKRNNMYITEEKGPESEISITVKDYTQIDFMFTMHNWNNGKCTICGASHYYHTWSNGKCTICGVSHNNHTWEQISNKHRCRECGLTHEPAWDDDGGAYYHWCSTCDYFYDTHTWSNGKCTTCGVSHYYHDWDNGTCRTCKASHNDHNWHEHRCMECGVTHSPNWDYYRDYKYCTICGLW